MAAVTNESSNVFTAPAVHEQVLAQEHDYTDAILLDITKLTTKAFTLPELVNDFLEGCGRVDLCKIELKAVSTAVSQKISLGIVEASSSLDASIAAMKPNGFMFVSNERTVGSEVIKHIVPEDTFSRQIRPQSSMLPSMKITITKDAGFPAALMIYLKVHGMRFRHKELK